MSRIHDALKKAEEQRQNLTGPHPAGFSGITDIPMFPPETVTGGEVSLPVPGVKSQIDADLKAADVLANCSRPNWRPTKDALFLTGTKENVQGMEEFRKLRARLFQIRAKKPLKTVLVSSALPEEGKSFVSANLAQAFALQRGGRTLLIDADLRKPHMHTLLGAPSSPGLYEYLAGDASESEIIQRSSSDDLFFIPAGEVNSTAGELVGSGRMKHLLETLAPLFSWIVIDSSPVIPVSDPTRLAEICDGVLLVVRAGSTSHVVAERAKREFHEAPLLGIVFNRVSRKENPYYQYSYQNYSK